MFHQNRRLRAVIVETGPTFGLVCRDHLEFELAGPYGYGRSLHARSTAADLVPDDTLTLAAGLSLSEAANQILAANSDSRTQDVLVVGGAAPRVVAVAAVFEQLAMIFRHVALHDPLTSLPNRRLLDQYGADLVDAGLDRGRIAVLYIDLDGFKMVNDTFGHRAGDDILIDFAERLKTCIRPDDLVARLGGDEFAALLVDVSEVQAMAIAERIVLNASAPFLYAGEPLSLSASVGVAMADDIRHETGLTQLDALLRQADGAMLRAKRTGKRRVERLPGGDESNRIVRRAAIRRRLRDALNRDEGLTLHYQPKLDLATGDLQAVEALIRWTDAELGSVSPGEFIPIAEDNDQITRVGQWVLDRACRQARQWLDDGTPRIVSINVSAAQLSNPALAEDITDALRRHELPAQLLRIEVTETAAIADLPSTVLQLLALRRLGVEIELDDFGTGYSSIGMLRDLPLSTVKIDKSFIDDIDTDPAAQALVEGIVQAAHALGLTVTAEGVERREQLASLTALGCDTAQGFYIARPAPAEHLHRSRSVRPAFGPSLPG